MANKKKVLAQDLPAMQPGTTLSVPLDVLPEYMALNHLVSVDFMEKEVELVVVHEGGEHVQVG